MRQSSRTLSRIVFALLSNSQLSRCQSPIPPSLSLSSPPSLSLSPSCVGKKESSNGCIYLLSSPSFSSFSPSPLLSSSSVVAECFYRLPLEHKSLCNALSNVREVKGNHRCAKSGCVKTTRGHYEALSSSSSFRHKPSNHRAPQGRAKPKHAGAQNGGHGCGKREK